MQYLKKYNGTRVEVHERRDFELFYLKIAYEEYLRMLAEQSGNKDVKVENVEDPDMARYMEVNHPRFSQLVGIYGSPLDMVNLKKEGKNIAQTSATMELINMLPGQENSKTFKKKLLLTMSVTNLKGMCSKLFKINVLEQYLCYQGPEDT